MLTKMTWVVMAALALATSPARGDEGANEAKEPADTVAQQDGSSADDAGRGSGSGEPTEAVARKVATDEKRAEAMERAAHERFLHEIWEALP